MAETVNDQGKLTVYLFVLIATIYIFCSGGVPWLEADAQLDAAKSLVREGTLARFQLPKEAQNESSTEFAIMSGDFCKKGACICRRGSCYDFHGITNVLLMTPVALLEYVVEPIWNKSQSYDLGQAASFLGALTGIVVNASVCIIFLMILLLWEAPPRIAVLSTYCLAFLTMVFPHSSHNYEGNLNMFFILTSLYFLFSFLKREKSSHLLFAGAFAGLAFCTREFSALFLLWVVSFAFFFCYRKGQPKKMLYFFFGLSPFVALWGYYNWLRTGYFYLSAQVVDILGGEGNPPIGNIAVGLKSILFSYKTSMFCYSPILVLSILGWRQFIAKRKWESSLCLAVVVSFLLATAKLKIDFPWSWGPRYLLEIVPIMMLPLTFWLWKDNHKRGASRISFIVLALYSLLIQLAGTLTGWYARAPRVFDFGLCQWCDSVRTLLINLSNLLFGKFFYIENPGFFPHLSDATFYMSSTLFTWWNRLIFMGASPILIGLYIFVSGAVALFCLVRIEQTLDASSPERLRQRFS